MVVNGTLLAEGTAAEPIRFTGLHEEKPGEWRDIAFGPGSGGSVLDNVEIAYGGSNGYYAQSTVHINGSSPTITNSTFRDDGYYAIEVPSGGSPEISHDRFLDDETGAIYYRSTESQSGEILIHDNLVRSSPPCAGCTGILIQAMGSSPGAGTLSGNTIEGLGEEPLDYSGTDIPGDVTQNTLLGNVRNWIEVSGTVAHSSTWVDGGSVLRGGGLTIASGVTLRVEPGVEMLESEYTVNGTLLAEGTAAEPIRFTGLHEEKPGEWRDIAFGPGSGGSVLDNVEIAYGGSNGYYAQSTVHINGSSPTITNSTFRDDGYYAIEVPSGGSPEISHDRFLDDETGAIYYRSTESQSGEILIHDNLVRSSPPCAGCTGILIQAMGSSPGAGTLSGNTIEGLGEEPLDYSGTDIPGDVTQNTLLGNVRNWIEVSGTVAHSSTWVDGGSVLRGGGLTIASGVTLRVEPGVEMLESEYTVNGTLLAEGTAAEPIRFTGLHEEKPGEWRDIAFGPGSGGSVLDNVEIAYGGSNGYYAQSTVHINGSSPTITNSTFRDDGYYAIEVPESGKPTIEYDRFREDASGLSYSGAGKLEAPNNDWGCPNGPKPAGCGAEVTSNVEWKPAASLPELGGHLRGPESQGGEGADPVILSTGALDYIHTDLSLPSKGEPLQFTRTYSSDSAADSGLGTGWSQTGLSTATELASGEVLVVRPDGRQDLFAPEGAGYKAPSGVTDTLAKVEGSFRLTTLEGSVYRFDTSGRISSLTDAHGLVTSWIYNPEGRLASITDPSGQSLSFSYNGSNHITAVKDSTGREVKFGYSAAGELETVTDPLGHTTKYSYEGHRLKAITDARGHVILTNVYDGQGRISEQEDGTGGVWHMAYSPGQTTVTGPDGGERAYGFDSQDRVVSETDALGHTTTISYDVRGQVESVDRPGGADWHLGHDATGNLTSVTDPEGGESTWAYEAHNHPREYTDADGHTWHYEWSASGDLEKQTDPEGGATVFENDSSGRPISVTDPDGQTVELAYNALGERTSLGDPLGHEWTWGYDTRGYETSSTEPGLEAETLERDALGDLLSGTTPEGDQTHYEYDADGLLVKTTDPGGEVWRIERDAMERPIAYIDPLGHEVKVTWTGDLKPATFTNRDGATTTFRYDAADQLVEREGPEGETWGFGYDARGERTSTTDPRGHATTYEYDLLGRLTKTVAPLGSVGEYAYDPAGRLASWTDPDGHTTELTYDDRGLLTAVRRPLGQTTTYGYDAAGEQTAKTTAEASLEYAYDEAGRLAGISDGGEALRSFSYEPDGRLHTAGVAGGPAITLGWTEDGLLSSLEDGRGQSVARAYDSRGDLTKLTAGAGTVEYAYDALGRMESLTDPQGRTTHLAYSPEGSLTGIGRPGGIDTTNVYDEAGRLAETTTVTGEATLESLAYGYDADGDPTSMTNRSGEESTYAFDALDRLTGWNPPGPGSTTYGYDPAGNRTSAGSTTYSFNALDQLTEASTGTTYSYDGDGRLAKTEGGSGTITYAWDPLDELTGIEGPGAPTTLTYDALGRLASRSSGEATRSLHYGDLGDDPVLATQGEASEGLLYGPGGLLTETTEGEAATWPLLDGHGSVVAAVTGSGEAASRSSYGPWGETTEGEPGELGYLGGYGRPTDPSSGIVQMGARPYDPALGAFVSQDPVLGHAGVPMTLDPYPYVLDDPLGRYDLQGRDVFEDAEEAVGEAAEGVEEFGESVAGTAAEAPGFVADRASEWTAPARHAVATGAQEFAKDAKAFWKGFTTDKECKPVLVASTGWVPMCNEGGEGGEFEESPPEDAAPYVPPPDIHTPVPGKDWQPFPAYSPRFPDTVTPDGDIGW